MTHRVIVDAANAMFKDGDFTALGRVIGGDEIDGLLMRGARELPKH